MTDREALAQARTLMHSRSHEERETGATQRRYLLKRLGAKALLDVENAIKGRETQGRNTWKEKVEA